MKEKIQPYTIPGKGTASEAKVEVQSRFTTQDKAVIYYDLRDKSQTSQVTNIVDRSVQTLPYKILSYQKIVVTGNDRAAAVSDVSLAVNIVFRERTDIVKDSVDTNTYRYFAVRNKMTQRGRNGGRQTVDRGAYRLYEKPSASQTGLNNYTLLSESLGDPVDKIAIYGPKGQFIGYEDKYLTSNYGAGIIDIQVTIPTSGQPTYTVASNSRGDNFYINLIQPYL
jgi:hypothetical protein